MVEASGQSIDDLHKHTLDKITVPCPKCSGQMSRVPDVLDCWFESGSMPYAQHHYPFANRDKVDKNFPAQFIAEGVDQTRAWFYYLHVIATALKDQRAFNNVMVNGIVLAEDGKKMSKKLQNYPDPNEVMNRHSADALRWYLLSSPVMQAENLNFSSQGVEEALRQNSLLLWNVFKFYELYASPEVVESADSQQVLDIWIIARLNQLIAEITKQMTAYNLPKAIRPITEFINDLSTWYLRRSRDRFKADNQADKERALSTTKYVLSSLAKLLAPFAPFLAESLWQAVNNYNFQDDNQSVHLQSWPAAGRLAVAVLKNMEIAKQIVEASLAARDEAKIKIRQPLADLYVQGSALPTEYVKIIKEELNVKNIHFDAKYEAPIKWNLELTPELRAEGAKREIVRLINNLRKEAKLTIADKIIVYCQTDDEEIKQVMNKMKEEIMKDTLSADIIEFVDFSQVDFKKEVKINQAEITLGFKI